MNTIAAMEEQIKIAEENLCNIKIDLKIAEENLHELYLKLQTAHETPVREERTKLKWISSSNPETYRVAIVTKDGLLQVKSVLDGAGDCHVANCRCGPCWEYDNAAPWRRRPLNKVLFDDESAWRNTLPDGAVTVTLPIPSKKALRALCMKPLEAVTDALKLKELEQRFSEARFILTLSQEQIKVETCQIGHESYNQIAIYSRTRNLSFATFKEHGAEKVHLMAEWRGLYIDLSHLF
jgi:hypothetical protein